ncbi:MAG: carboxypeptidase regulatory-like domain-containing protein [Nannocystaceae bacterium]
MGALVLAPDEVRRGVDFVLDRGGEALRGVVSDVFGGPVEGAVVIATRAQGPTDLPGVDPRGLQLHAVSDAEGRFALALAAGDWLLRTRADGYARARAVVQVPGPATAIALVPEGTIAGIVVERASGKPVAGARIVLRQWRDSLPFDSTVGTTDEQGRYRIGGLAPGRYRPSATDGDRLGDAARSLALELGETIEDVRIEIDDAASVVATITVAPHGGPCPGGNVVLADANGDESRTAPIDADGVATLEGLVPGSYEVAVQCDDHSAKTVPHSLTVERGTQAVAWQVEAGHELRGRVIDHEGHGVRAHVAMSAATGAGIAGVRQLTSDADGRFVLRGVPAGDHTVTAQLRAGVRARETVAVGPATPERQLRIGPTATLRGVVRRGREPARGLQLQTFGLGTEREGPSTASTDDDGSYEIGDLTPGAYELVVHDDSRTELARRRVQLPERGATVDLTLPAEATVTGVVLDDGGPVPEVAVAAIDSASAASVEMRVDVLREATSATSVLTDAAGRFTIRGVSAEARFTVLAQRRGGGQASADGVRPGTPVTLRMQPLGEITGRVDGEHTAIGITLRRVDGGASLRDSFVFGDGSFGFDGVTPGSYEVVARARGGRGRARTEVTAGRTARVLVTLEPNVRFHGRFVDARTGAPLPEIFAVFGERDATLPELAALADRALTMRPAGIVSGPDGVFTAPDVPALTARLFAFSADIAAGEPAYLELITLAIGEATANPVDVPLVRVTRRVAIGSPLGFEVDLPQFCADTPVIAAITDPVRAAGLAVGDEIVAVDGIDTSKLRCYLLRGLLLPPAGARVELGLGDDRHVTAVAAAVP